MQSERIDVRAVRQKLGKTQVDFAAHFGVGVTTVKAWEQGRRFPNRVATTLLRVIERAPEVVDAVLAA